MTVAETLGWRLEQVPDLDGGTDPVWFCPNRCRPEREDGCWGHTHPYVTVDHMLAWLHDPTNARHGWTVMSITPFADGWSAQIMPWVGEYYEEAVGLTLHAALDEAVRVVSG